MNMQIKRNILGTEVTIDLTEGEILDAHYEAERYNARETLNERLMQEEGINKEIPAELFRQLVKEVMDEKSAMDNNMGDNLIPAINAVIEKHQEELNKYKEEEWKLFEIECKQIKKKTYTIRAKNDEDAEKIFAEWREHHIVQYDNDMMDMDPDDDEIGSPYECEDGNPDYADITVEEGY